MTDTPPEVLLFNTMSRLLNELTQHAELTLAGQDISPAQLRILAHLRDDGPNSQRDLALHMRTSAANISQLLRKMEAAGLVERPRDGVRKQAQLTDDGRAQLTRLLPRYNEAIAEKLSPLMAAEQQMLSMWLSRLLAD